jgi:F-type H+-transporting ATPase subunit epsilon
MANPTNVMTTLRDIRLQTAANSQPPVDRLLLAPAGTRASQLTVPVPEHRPVAQKSFRCKLVTPTAGLIDDKCVYASVPMFDGLLGVMPGRAPTLMKLGMGELRLDFADDAKMQGTGSKGGSRSFLIDGGFIKMANEELTILAEKAWATETLTKADAEAEARALQGAKPKDNTPAATEDLMHARALAAKKLEMAGKGGGI